MIGFEADFHRQVPRDPGKNVRWRQRVLEDAAGKPELQRGLKEMCRLDVLFWINAFVWQFNPKQAGGLEVGPFTTFGLQDQAVREILWCVENGKDLLIEKSRQMGASWLLVILFNYLYQFHKRKTLLFISRSEKAVEDETPNSLFWKIDFIQEHQPAWLLPGSSRRRKMYFGNDETHSAIFGEASTGKANVGGNTTAMGIDEFSQIEEDYEVLHRTSDSTRCRIFNGTHLGTDTALFELSQRENIRKLQMHWTAHPFYNQGMYRYDQDQHKIIFLRWRDDPGILEECLPTYAYPNDYSFVMDGSPTGGPRPGVRSPWYDEQCLRKGSDRAIAMDLDINPRGSVSQFFSPLMIHQLKVQYGCSPSWEGELRYDRDTGKPLELVKVPGGPVKIWCALPGGKPPLAPYGAGADIAAGTGATPSCLSVVNARTGEKALEYANAHIEAKDFAVLCVALCRLFTSGEGNDGAKFAWENHGPGVNFGKKVVELGYLNIYFRTAEHTLRREVSDTPGWSPMGVGKRVLLEEYRSALHQRRFLNRSEAALDECLSFKYDSRGGVSHAAAAGDDPTAARENHGDRVIADALAYKMIQGMGGAAKAGQEEESGQRALTMFGRRQNRDRQRAEEEAWV